MSLGMLQQRAMRSVGYGSRVDLCSSGVKCGSCIVELAIYRSSLLFPILLFPGFSPCLILDSLSVKVLQEGKVGAF